MKRKVKPVAKQIPRKDEDINIIASGMKAAASFKKPPASIDKHTSKGDRLI